MIKQVIIIRKDLNMRKWVTLECLKLALERAQIPKEYKAEIIGSKIIISLRRSKWAYVYVNFGGVERGKIKGKN